ncbi:MAG: hypothetical protein ACOWWR_05660 [Eubacteriales bacterium]
MLKKLLKYEFKATARIFMPFYLFLIIVSVVNRIFHSLNFSYFNIPKMITMGVIAFTVIGIFVMTLIVTIQRFYKNLLSYEGYLSFTLPIESHNHILAKGLIALMWYMLNVFICGLAVFILIVNDEVMAAIGSSISVLLEFIQQTGVPIIVIGLQLIVFLFITAFTAIVKIYAAISMTNFTNKYKILVGLGAYIGFDIAEQTILSIILIPAGFIGKAFDIFEKFQIETITSGSIILVLFVLSAIVLLVGCVYFFLTNWVLKNKLNLE